MRGHLRIRAVVAVGAFLLATAALAQAVAPEGERCFWAISVPDIEASVKWYQSIFGLRTTQQLITPDGSVKLIILEGPNLMVEVMQMTGADSLKKYAPGLKSRAMVHGLFKVGLWVADLEKTRRALEQRKVKMVTDIFEEQEGGVRSFVIEDNSGNTIQLFSAGKKPR